MKVKKFERISTANAALILSFASLIVFLIVCFFAAGVSEAQNTADPQFESKLNELLTTVYCYCGCERETIEVCVCGTAEQIEADFRNRLLAGQTVEQIRTNYLDTYGPQFYAVMPAKGINLLAYITPVGIMIFTGGLVLAILRRSKQRSVAMPHRDDTSGREISNTTLKQVEAELEKYKQEK